MRKVFVSFDHALPGDKSREVAEKVAAAVKDPAVEIVVLPPGVAVSVVDLPDPPFPAKTLKVTPPPKE